MSKIRVASDWSSMPLALARYLLLIDVKAEEIEGKKVLGMHLCCAVRLAISLS